MPKMVPGPDGVGISILRAWELRLEMRQDRLERFLKLLATGFEVPQEIIAKENELIEQARAEIAIIRASVN